MIELCRRGDLDPTGAKEVVLDRDGRPLRLVVVKCGEGFRAYVNSCPHARMRLNWKPDRFLDRTGAYLFCDNHVATFDIDTGACLRGPPKGKSLTPVTIVCRDDIILTDPAALPT